MATIIELQEKVANATAKVEKIKITIQKHEASATKKLLALAKYGINAENMEEKKWLGGVAGTGGSANYWEICEIEGKLNDAKGATRKLKEAEAILVNWQSKLDITIEKDRFLNDNAPEVIKEFLEKWKAQAYDWHIHAYARYVELKQLLRDEKKAVEERFSQAYPNGRTWGKDYETFMKGEKELSLIKGSIAMFGGLITRMDTFYNEAERLAYLEKELEADKKYKMLDLINRVNAIVGTITDASLLNISNKGNLDGYIIGEKAKAKVETIGAGGYNIQCFHFRTLVHEI